jgi:Cof subfamily protein (haloacid dehalogenase superfamily)
MDTAAILKNFHPSRIKAVAIDLDGTTLRPDSTMGGRTIAALRSCLERGIQVIIASGRSPVAAEQFRKAIGAEGPMVFYNGAAVIDSPSGAIRASTLLKRNISLFCAETSRDMDVHFHAFLPGDRLVFAKERAESATYAQRTGLRGDVVDLVDLFGPRGSAASGCIKGMFIAEPAVLDRVQAKLDAAYGDLVYRARSHATFLEVMAAGVSKGQALKTALELRGLKGEDILVFGDAENDLPMFGLTRYSAAPANAEDRIRSAALWVVPSNTEEGPAQFLEERILAGAAE